MVKVWQPITDLPQDWNALTDGELGPLLQFWNDQRADLEQSGVLAGFTQRLAREWSIETGQIEGVYDIDRGITQTLIERGINADFIGSQPGQKPPELIAAIIQDHADVLEGLFQFVKDSRALSKSYIHELHAGLLRHQDTTMALDQFGNLFESKLMKGKYKQYPNNPKKPDGSIHQYCPPEQVDSEMERLLEMHARHRRQGIPVEVEVAWLHHRFTQIHPYQDGNGRVARSIASVIFLKERWFPVVVTRDDRARYLDALEVADEGDLRSLSAFFASVQKRELLAAMQAAADLQPIQNVDEAIGALKRVLESRGKSVDPGTWLKTKGTADHLIEVAASRLNEIAAALKEKIGMGRPELDFRSFKSYGFLLEGLPYMPNTGDYDQVRGLFIETKKHGGNDLASIQIHAHGISSKFRGLIGIVMIFCAESGLVQIASKEPFQVNYAEPYESAERRFRPWLEESLVNALTLWRKRL